MSSVRAFCSRHRLALGVAGMFLLLRLVSGFILATAARYQEPSWLAQDTHPYFALASSWDGGWYRTIAEDGYPGQIPRWGASDEVRQNPWAFYPAYPLLVRGLMALFGTGFAPTATTLSLVLGVAGAVVMARLVESVLGRTAAWATVALYAAFPAAPVLQMAYTESLAMLLLCLFLWAVHRERWLVAAALALLTGVSRPIALPLGLVALVALVVRWRRRAGDPLGTREALRGLVALIACGLSGLIWPAYAWYRTGERDAYTLTMQSWRGGQEIVPFRNWGANAEYLLGPVAAPLVLLALVITVAGLVLGPWARGLGPVLRTWCLGYALYLGAVLDPWTSTFRYLLPLFPLFAVLAGAAWPRAQAAAGDAARRAGLLAVRAEAAWRTDLAIWARTCFIAVWFVALQAVWVWELVIFIPPADDPP